MSSYINSYITIFLTFFLIKKIGFRRVGYEPNDGNQIVLSVSVYVCAVNFWIYDHFGIFQNIPECKVF